MPKESYIRRVPDNRDLSDRIYKLRYVIPNDITNQNAKAPEKNFVLQESKTTGWDKDLLDGTTLSGISEGRNQRVIAGITTIGNVVTVTTEMPHGLTVNDRVTIKNVKSSANTTGDNSEGFNGYYTVTGINGTKNFTYTYDRPVSAGNFTSDVNTRNSSLPALERNEYDSTYTIQDVETIQEYIKDQQDGVYYLTCLIGNISPQISPFQNLKYKQNSEKLYPTVDKDNIDVDPNQAVSSASNKTLGKVLVNDSLNSITKASVISYLEDNRVGFAITSAESSASGISTITFKNNHNFRRIIGVEGRTDGSGYVNGTYYNVPLQGGSGSDATAKVVVASGGIDDVKIQDPGCGYGLSDTLTFNNSDLGGSGSGGSVDVQQVVPNLTSSISGDSIHAIQVIGVGTTDERNYSAYNGLYEINSIPSSNSISYKNGTNAGIHTNFTTGIALHAGEVLGVSSITWDSSSKTISVACCDVDNDNVSKEHGLQVGNKIKGSGFVGSAGTIMNADFFVSKIVDKDNFIIKSDIGITTAFTTGTPPRIMRYVFGSLGQDTSLATEKIGGSLNIMSGGVIQRLYGPIAANDSTVPCKNEGDGIFTGVDGLSIGSFIQIDDEIMRVFDYGNANQVRVFRGVLGTKATTHVEDAIVREIKVVPSEVRRFSSIRASGHTFEYVGYGPGNYSTALPQRIQRTLSAEEELLSISKEEKGGIVFFSGMNDRGDFFTGERAPRETFLSDDTSDLTGIFDDLYVRNTLRVGGGPNQNLPSEFNGPVNFSNKLTSTDATDGINAIKLMIQVLWKR